MGRNHIEYFVIPETGGGRRIIALWCECDAIYHHPYARDGFESSEGKAEALLWLHGAVERTFALVADEIGINLTDARLLAYVDKHGSQSIAELATRLCLSQSSTTVCVQRLETCGLMINDDHPEDRRRRIRTLTESGRAAAQLINRRLIACLVSHA